jgi:antibiotic biosynthesis monooxygenase (ABM) superfamily enzyme
MLIGSRGKEAVSNHVIETVTFRLVDGASQEQFLKAAEQASAFMTARPGFLQRRLSCEENGTWIEHVEWATMADAKAAAAEIGMDEQAQAFLRAIDGPSVKIAHSELKVSVG